MLAAARGVLASLGPDMTIVSMHEARCLLAPTAAQTRTLPRLPRSAPHSSQDASGHAMYEFAPRGEQVALGIKLAGVHWCCKSRGHAAELTAGYYNTAQRNGYEAIIRLMRRHGAHLSFTCVEMRDCEHPADGHCSPEQLLDLIIKTAAQHGKRGWRWKG